MEGTRSSLPITAVHGFLDLGYRGGDVMSAEVPHFHPGVLLDQSGFGFGLGNAAVGGESGRALRGEQHRAGLLRQPAPR
jgi:hypothetical protein